MGYNPWGCKESDTTEQLHLHCIVMACSSTLVAVGVNDIFVSVCFSLSVVLVCRLLSSCGGGGHGGVLLFSCGMRVPVQ